jgi:hypothetical protein
LGREKKRRIRFTCGRCGITVETTVPVFSKNEVTLETAFCQNGHETTLAIEEEWIVAIKTRMEGRLSAHCGCSPESVEERRTEKRIQPISLEKGVT